MGKDWVYLKPASIFSFKNPVFLKSLFLIPRQKAGPCREGTVNF
jgi:hypothetical protein